MSRGITIALALLLVACGDDDAAQSSGTPSAGSGASGSGGNGTSSSASTGSGGSGGTPLPTTPHVYVGTEDGTVEHYLLDRVTGALSPQGEPLDVGGNPSFLAATPDHLNLYAVDEWNDEVMAFSIDPESGALTEIGSRQSSEGGGPAHVSVDRSGQWVLVANYGSGDVAVLPIEGDGSLGPAVDVETPGENAHLILADPSNDFVFVPCLGSELVAQFTFDDATGELTANGTAPLPEGTGPRHLDFHPSLQVVYVIGEHGDTLTTFDLEADGTLTNPDSVSTLPGGEPDDENSCADVHVRPDGAYVYGSNRGDDSIAIFAIDSSTGRATPAGHAPTGGATPRNFHIDPEGDVMLVANQGSDNVVTFSIDRASGGLDDLMTGDTANGPSWVGVVTQQAPSR
jgi:6-phosphogluconolactonase